MTIGASNKVDIARFRRTEHYDMLQFFI